MSDLEQTTSDVIFIFDDDRQSRESLSELLSDCGYQVAVAGSTVEAYDVFVRTSPALVIIVTTAPEAAVNWLTELRNYGSQVPVVFISSTWCDPESFKWLRNILTVSLVLQKPIEREKILQQLQSLLPRRTTGRQSRFG